MKRCECYWRQPNKAANVRCSERATRLLVRAVGALTDVVRCCQACADRFVEIGRDPTRVQVLGVLDMQKDNRTNPETIRALQVRHALEQSR
jgi:hypothetical protein